MSIEHCKREKEKGPRHKKKNHCPPNLRKETTKNRTENAEGGPTCKKKERPTWGWGNRPRTTMKNQCYHNEGRGNGKGKVTEKNPSKKAQRGERKILN